MPQCSQTIFVHVAVNSK